MTVKTFFGRGFASNAYLVLSDDGTHALIVDPSLSVGEARRRLMSELPVIDAIVLTHAHFDHMLALDGWIRETGAPVFVSAADAPALQDANISLFLPFLGEDRTFPAASRLLYDGDTVAVGKERLTVLHTPGHTPGSIVLRGDGFLLTGDTVFEGGGYGRTDFPGGSMGELVTSLRRIFSLDGEYTLYPGHGDNTTLTREKRMHRL